MTPVIPIPEQLLIVLIVPAAIAAAAVIAFVLHRHVPMGGTWTAPRPDAGAPPEREPESDRLGGGAS
jgi:hypothetical protein